MISEAKKETTEKYIKILQGLLGSSNLDDLSIVDNNLADNYQKVLNVVLNPMLTEPYKNSALQYFINIWTRRQSELKVDIGNAISEIVNLGQDASSIFKPRFVAILSILQDPSIPNVVKIHHLKIFKEELRKRLN